MRGKMGLSTRQELLSHLIKQYKNASWKNKINIIDELVGLTGYSRKHAISLLNQADNPKKFRKNRVIFQKKYDQELKLALLQIWEAANQICAKRLVPFIPELLVALERFGHLSLTDEVRAKLLTISPATVDRLLHEEHRVIRQGLCTTKPGGLLKKQIKIRTFSDWEDVVPGFLEGDLVAHCGNTTEGAYLNTLVLTDVASTWTEFLPILRKGEVEIVGGISAAQTLFPFEILGLDTDNGSEFINYHLLNFCQARSITFTRSRPYKKNDQAHVEEKNGSIVRRIIGYDRYEGIEAYQALAELYAVLRLYVNFFQPSCKLIYKKRDGAKISKKYDKAQTAYQRLMRGKNLTESQKSLLHQQYINLDPVELISKLKQLQDRFELLSNVVYELIRQRSCLRVGWVVLH